MILKKYVEACKPCTLTGPELDNTKNKIIKATFPNEIWEIDLIGRLKSGNGQNKFIFVAIDHYTKWIETAILNKKDAYSTIRAVKELILDKHGTPHKIISDNGLEFNNEQSKKLASNYNIEWIFNSPGHHETTGCVKMVNQTLMRKLSRLTNVFEDRWENKLKEATFGVKISFNRAIRTSPHIIKFGFTPELQIDRKLGKTSNFESLVGVRNKRDENFDAYAEKYIKKGKIACKYNLEPGDSVAIFKKELGTKLGTNCHSGYKVVHKILPDAYLVEKDQKTYRINKKHVKRI